MAVMVAGGGEVWELHAQCWASLLWSPGLGWPQLAAPWSQWRHGAGPGNTAQQPATQTQATQLSMGHRSPGAASSR